MTIKSNNAKSILRYVLPELSWRGRFLQGSDPTRSEMDCWAEIMCAINTDTQQNGLDIMCCFKNNSDLSD